MLRKLVESVQAEEILIDQVCRAAAQHDWTAVKSGATELAKFRAHASQATEEEAEL